MTLRKIWDFFFGKKKKSVDSDISQDVEQYEVEVPEMIHRHFGKKFIQDNYGHQGRIVKVTSSSLSDPADRRRQPMRIVREDGHTKRVPANDLFDRNNDPDFLSTINAFSAIGDGGVSAARVQNYPEGFDGGFGGGGFSGAGAGSSWSQSDDRQDYTMDTSSNYDSSPGQSDF